MFYLCCIVMICSIIIVLFYRYQIKRTYASLNNMIDSIMENSFEEEVFDESRLSALENKFAHYLLASQVSSRIVAQEREKIKGLITDISHQTRTPISNILLYSEMLMEDCQSDEDRQNLEAMYQQAEKLKFLIDSLIKLSRLETGIITVNTVRSNVKDLAAEACTQYEPLAEQKGLSIHFIQSNCDSVNNGYIAKCDKKWTMEAVGNIIDNAIKYTHKGSITISVKEYEMFCCIEIADTGIGISEEEMPLIFKRFYRSQAVNQIQGIGVGLYLAREIISAENGYIKVVSKLGKGTIFFVYLPK
ncbi:MAG: HAMP domain-containing histidine kinase [Lachnospiraceae bacterium]|nr:HAMP domain-containing histidine kinase [Lachnospiraceae bacterium]